ncbi:hypothetical protein FRC06_001085, partial [Ceratobasidium sp. 370]
MDIDDETLLAMVAARGLKMRPTASVQQSTVAQPPTATQPPAAPTQPAAPIQTATRTQSAASTLSAAPSAQSAPPAWSAPPARSTAPVRTTSSARAVRRSVSGSILAASQSARHNMVPTVQQSAELTVPAQRQLTSRESTALLTELAQIRDSEEKITFAFIGRRPSLDGQRKTSLDVKALLELSNEGWGTLRRVVKTSLQRTPGIDMTKTATMQASQSVIDQAIKQVVAILPDFEAYAAYDYWPLDITVHKVLRSSTNTTQSRKRKKEGRRANLEQAAGESNANVDNSGVTNGKEVEEPVHVEVPSAVVHTPEVPNTAVTTQDEVVANLAQDMGNMSVDVPWAQDEEMAPAPFTLPADLTGNPSTGASAVSSESALTPPPTTPA